MTTPRQYAKDFAKIWEMGFPIHGSSSETGQGSAGIMYGGSIEQVVRRNEGEFMTLARAKLRQILDEGAYVTDPCKEALVKHAEIMGFFGTPPAVIFPLDSLGINLPEEKYGPFDEHADLKSIEGKLLEFSEGTALDPEIIEISQRWHPVYIKRYG